MTGSFRWKMRTHPSSHGRLPKHGGKIIPRATITTSRLIPARTAHSRRTTRTKTRSLSPHNLPVRIPVEQKGAFVAEDRVTIYCDGGRGRSVTLRKSRVRPHQFYVCNSRKSGDACMAALPTRLPGHLCGMDLNAAAHFMGVTYTLPSEEDAASVNRARAILAAGRALLAKKSVEDQEEYPPFHPAHFPS